MQWQTQSLEKLYGGADAHETLAADSDATASASRPAEGEQGGKDKGGSANAETDWVQKAEDFVALVITRYLSHLFVHLRHLLQAVVVGVILMLLTVMVYPFHPQELLFCYLGGLLAAVMGVFVYIFVKINRDEVMSHLANTTPNQFTPDSAFVQQIVQYVLPVLGILVIQFSAVSALVRWAVEPLLRVFH